MSLFFLRITLPRKIIRTIRPCGDLSGRKPSGQTPKKIPAALSRCRDEIFHFRGTTLLAAVSCDLSSPSALPG